MVGAYTPINEPLTTARFSGLYGHWYPHGRDNLTFARALLNECKATALAMRVIRVINPAAELVLTEDLGFTRSSPRLAYQAAFENERRWLSIDLLCGRVDDAHPLRPWLRAAGIPDRDLDWFLAAPCPPDLIGCNYYVTSERYLDERASAWPARTRGGNGRDRYADVEAALVSGLVGVEPLLRAAWERFGIPIAITEVHLGCTREEQLRWLVQIHDAALRAWRSGIPVRAITAWALFGSYDWHCLVTREEGQYEPGLFDVRGPAYDDAAAWSEPQQVVFDRKIRVPYPPESVASGIGDTGFHPVCWYRLVVQVTEEERREGLILHFGAIDYHARVWVNGHLVAQHEGGHTPLFAEVRDALGGGDRLQIVVRAFDDPVDLAQPRGKQDWLERPHEIWYPRTSGIWQTVWLEPVPMHRFHRVTWTPHLEHWEMGLGVELAGGYDPGMSVRVRLRHRDQVLADDRYQISGREIGRRIAFADPGIDDYRNHLLWSPAHPTLIEAELELWCRGLAGFCYTQLTDTFQECNGLLTAHRVPKAPLPRIYPWMRMPGRLKYLAGSEVGAGAFTADTLPEAKAAELRAVELA